MKLCNAYSLLRESEEIRLKNKTFPRLTAVISRKDGKLPSMSFLQGDIEIDTYNIEYVFFMSILQSDFWELVEPEN